LPGLYTHCFCLNLTFRNSGRDGENAVAFTCPAPAGAKLTFEFRAWPDARQPGAIDASHLGSAAIYLKQVSNIRTDAAAGPGWFKIYDEGYDASSKKWATEKLIANDGLLSVNLPSGLPTGYYLARTEIISLQNVTDDAGVDPQPYVNCAQIFVQGQASASPLSIPEDKEVSIPGHVTASHPGLTFNIYHDDPLTTPYQVVGPAVFFPSSSTPTTRRRQLSRCQRKSSLASTQTQTQPQTQPTSQPNTQTQTLKQTDGLIPEDCVVKNANWCASPLPAYTDEASCWAASSDCWRQVDECYSSAPPSGYRGCSLWEKGMCEKIQAECGAGRWNGPPSELADALANEVVDAPVPSGGKIPAAANA
jgi:hypothetical protein